MVRRRFFPQTTDVASAPLLLWIVPLSLHLLTFIIAFSTRNRFGVARSSAIFGVASIISILAMASVAEIPTLATVPIHLILVFSGGMLCRSLLADKRPPPEHLTECFLLMSVGGVLGGAFDALVCPVVFNQVLEYPIVIVLALLLRPGILPIPRWNSRQVKLDVELPILIVAGSVAVGLVSGRILMLASSLRSGS